VMSEYSDFQILSIFYTIIAVLQRKGRVLKGILLFSYLIVSVGFAAVNEKPLPKKAEEVEKNTSEYWRSKRKNSIEYLYGNNFGSMSTGLSISRKIENNQSFILEYLSLSEFYSDREETEDSEIRTNGYAVGAQFRKFFNNSFYMQLGLYYRSQNGFNIVRYQNNAWIEQDPAFFEDLGFAFRIGNQWQWKYFNLGVDWVGASRTITALSRSEDARKYSQNELSFLNLHIGFAF
jgi:hypothetical protein